VPIDAEPDRTTILLVMAEPWQVGELGGRRAVASDDVADENERLAAEIAAMQAQLDPHASAAAGLVTRLELPEVCSPTSINRGKPRHQRDEVHEVAEYTSCILRLLAGGECGAVAFPAQLTAAEQPGDLLPAQSCSGVLIKRRLQARQSLHYLVERHTAND